MNQKIHDRLKTEATEVSPEAVNAARELVAEALRQGAGVLNIQLSDLTYEGRPIGTFEVSVRRLD